MKEFAARLLLLGPMLIAWELCWGPALVAQCTTPPPLTACQTGSGVYRWRCWEGPELTTVASYNTLSSYRDMKVRVTFTKASQSFSVYAFWDRSWDGSNSGRQVFRFRTAFPTTGTWAWRSSCEGGGCGTDSGVHDKTGTVSVQTFPLTTQPATYFNGFLQKESRPYLRWANGGPFRWVGDSAWAAPIRSSDADWACYVLDRAAKKFSVLHVAIAPEWAASCDVNGASPFSNPPWGSGPCPDVRLSAGTWSSSGMESIMCESAPPPESDIRPNAASRPNKAFWDRLDLMIEFANQKGLVVFLVGLAEPVNRYPALADVQPLARWITARYSGNFVIFSPGFDDGVELAGVISDLGTTITSTSSRHLVINHPGTNGHGESLATSVNTTLQALSPFQDDPWLAAQMFQSGFVGGNVTKVTGRPRLLANAIGGNADAFRIPVRPAINGEAIYDHGYDEDSLVSGLSQFNRLRSRQAGYLSWLAGAAGFTAGTAGIWDWGACGVNAQNGRIPQWCTCPNQPTFQGAYSDPRTAMYLDSSWDLRRLADNLSLVYWPSRVTSEQWRLHNDRTAGWPEYTKGAVSRSSQALLVYAAKQNPIKINLKNLPDYLPIGTLIDPTGNTASETVVGTLAPDPSFPDDPIYAFPNPAGVLGAGSADRLLRLVPPPPPCIGNICWESPVSNALDLRLAYSVTEQHLVVSTVLRDQLGAPLGQENILSPASHDSPAAPTWTRTPLGFAAVWQNDSEAGGEIWGHRLAASSAPSGAAFLIASGNADSQVSSPSVASDEKGRLLVAWEQRDVETAQVTLQAAWFSPHGESESTVLALDRARGNARGPHAACASRGDADCWLVWESGEADSRGQRLFAQRISSSGQMVDTEIEVTSEPRAQLWLLGVTASSTGFAVLWEVFDEKGQAEGRLRREFSSKGEPLGNEEWDQ